MTQRHKRTGANAPSRPVEPGVRRGAAGMTLLEVMAAVFLVALTALAVAPLFALAANNNATGRDQGLVGAMALDTIEELLGDGYENLVAGGSLTSDTTGYSDVDDPEFVVRWEITDNISPVNTKTVAVRVIAVSERRGPANDTTLSTVVAR
jgi:type II secretory pathway pseudopilin PulG